MSININQVGGTAVAKNSGNKDNGTQRVCLATDDINISAMKTDIENIQTDIETLRDDVAILKSILTDIWDSTAHGIRTV